MTKADSAFVPHLKRGIYIFCDERNLARPANLLEFFGIGPWGGKHKNRAAIRGSHCDPTITGFEANISNQTESKLVQVEMQASILIANENCTFKNTQVGFLPIQAGSGRVDPTG
jgi:hypothetical protein